MAGAGTKKAQWGHRSRLGGEGSTSLPWIVPDLGLALCFCVFKPRRQLLIEGFTLRPLPPSPSFRSRADGTPYLHPSVYREGTPNGCVEVTMWTVTFPDQTTHVDDIDIHLNERTFVMPEHDKRWHCELYGCGSFWLL